jgi:tetratricopeptide (TPR) repeat protein
MRRVVDQTAGGRPAALLLALTLSAASLAACSPLDQPRTFDSEEYLRAQYAKSAGAEAAAAITVPFAIDEAIRKEAHQRLNPALSETRRVDQILDFVFGWLELEYRLTPTRDAVGTYHERRGNCLSFVNLFVGLAREFRLNPYYVEVHDYQRWNFSQGSVVSHGHIVAGLRIDGDLSTFDFLPYRPKSYRDFEPISDLKATAHYYNNLGAEALMAGDLESARRNVKIAVDLAPEFEKALNNLGVILLRSGEPERALEVFRRGLEMDPQNVAMLTNAARTHQAMGRISEANELLGRLEGVQHSNPFFYLYRGELALGEGDLETALDYMRKAYRRDSEIPEVHLGLVKVYLAIGDRQRALHHVERALKLDATHLEARRYAAMLSGGAEHGER